MSRNSWLGYHADMRPSPKLRPLTRLDIAIATVVTIAVFVVWLLAVVGFAGALNFIAHFVNPAIPLTRLSFAQ